VLLAEELVVEALASMLEQEA